MAAPTRTAPAVAPAPPRPPRGGRWIDDWRPEDPAFWETTGRRVARRNLFFSVFSEHVGFSIWSLWSVLVLFLPEAVYGIDPAGKFLLTTLPTALGAVVTGADLVRVVPGGGDGQAVQAAVTRLRAALGPGLVQAVEGGSRLAP